MSKYVENGVYKISDCYGGQHSALFKNGRFEDLMSKNWYWEPEQIERDIKREMITIKLVRTLNLV